MAAKVLALKPRPPTITLSMVSITASSTLGSVSKAITAIHRPPAIASTIRLRYSALIGSRERRINRYATWGQSRALKPSNAHQAMAEACSYSTAATHSEPTPRPIMRMGYMRLPKLRRRAWPLSLSMRRVSPLSTFKALVFARRPRGRCGRVA